MLLSPPGRAVVVPLRARLTLAFAVGMAAVLIGLGAVIYLRLGALLLQQVDANLRSRSDGVLATMTGRDPPPLRPERLLDPDESFAQILAPSGTILRSTSAVTGAPLLSATDLAALRGPTFATRRVAGLDDPARLLATPTRLGGRPVVLVMGATLGDRSDALQSLLKLYAVAGPAALVLTSLAGWRVAASALRPVERMRSRAAELAQADDARGRLPVPPTRDELTRLATTMNDLLARRQEALEREHRFVDYASHELRTPLAVLKAELDLASARSRTPEELTQTLAVAARQTDRTIRLAEDLLVLARMRGGSMPLRPVDVDLARLLREVAGTFQSRAGQAGTAVVVDATCGTARVDPIRIRQAVQNLVENALLHGAGPVRVSATQQPAELRIEVSDHGCGFPPSLLPSVFEPFTRAPAVPGNGRPGRTPAGSGLGLAVVRAVAEAHDGTAEARNLSGGGASVLIHIPTVGHGSGDG